MSRPRRIVVNTAIYLHGTSGTATATRALVAALQHLDDVEVQEVAPRSRKRSTVLNAVADARWDLWRASRVVPDIDLLVSPCNIGLRGRARRHLLVVHDVMAIEHPELFDRKFSAYFRLLVPPSVRSADRVLTLSEGTAAAVRRMHPRADVRLIGWPHDGGHVTPVVFPAHHPVVLMVGATEPLKNHVAGVDAVAELRASTGAEISLRVIGPVGRAEAAVRTALKAVDPEGSWSSREVDVPPEALDCAYRSAWVLLQPSHNEGFGLPLVEAARHGLPSVHSGRGAMPSVMPEVNAGGVHPEALADAMIPLLDRSRWECAAASAAQRARAFSPEVFQARLVAEVDELLQEPQ